MTSIKVHHFIYFSIFTQKIVRLCKVNFNKLENKKYILFVIYTFYFPKRLKVTHEICLFKHEYFTQVLLKQNVFIR